MASLSGDYTDGYKFYKNENGDICFRDIDGTYLSVAKSMPFDKLLELESRPVPIIDSVVESKYNVKNDICQSKSVNLSKIKTERKPVVVKPYFKKANKRVRGKSQILDFYVCTFCGTHHTDDTDECADCISNYEKDMKYTNNKILEISNDSKIGLVIYNSIMNTINEYRVSPYFRGFRYIDISVVGMNTKIIIYLIDNNNRMTRCKAQYDESDYESDDMYGEYEYNYLEMDYLDEYIY